MVDIQLIQCKNQQKTSPYGRNIVPYKEIGIKESSDDVRTLTGPFLRMRSENMAKNCPKCCQIAKIWTG